MPQYSKVPGPSFWPIPAALVSFRSPGGQLRNHPVGWVGVVCDHPPRVTVCFRREADGREPLRKGERFFVNLPREEFLHAMADQAQRQVGSAAPDRLLWPPCTGEGREELQIAASPVRMECRCLSVKIHFDQYRVRGEVVAVYLEGHRHEVAAPVDFCHFLARKKAIFQGLGDCRRASNMP